MAPTNVKTVHRTSLLHTESNLDRLGLLSPTHGWRSRQQSGQITPQSASINKPKSLKGTRHGEVRKIEIPRSMAVKALSWWSRRASQHQGIQSPVHPWKTPQKICPFAAPCRSSYKENRPWSEVNFSLRNLPVRAFDSRAQGFSTPLARRRSSCRPPPPDLGLRTQEYMQQHACACCGAYQAYRDSAPCLSRATTTSRKAPNSSSEVNTMLNQPSCRVSSNRLNCEDSLLVASLEGESSPTPARKTFRPSHTHTPRPGFGDRGHVYNSINTHTSGIQMAFSTEFVDNSLNPFEWI